MPPDVRSRDLLRLGSSRAFFCEDPDGVVRQFWWRRMGQGYYAVSRSISPYLPLEAYASLVFFTLGLLLLLLGNFLAAIRRS
jgi:hypothetical protein